MVRFSLEDDGFAIEAIVKKNFIWCKVCEAFVSKYQTIVNIADMPDEQMMVGKGLAKGTGPNLFTDGNDLKSVPTPPRYQYLLVTGAKTRTKLKTTKTRKRAT